MDHGVKWWVLSKVFCQEVLGWVAMARMWSTGSGRCWVVVVVLGASCILLWTVFCGWCGMSSWWGILIASSYQSRVPFDICELVVGLVSFVFTILPCICKLPQLVGVILLVFVLIFGRWYGLVTDLVIPLVWSLWLLVFGVLTGCTELGNWVCWCS